jgi:hypothetical protein
MSPRRRLPRKKSTTPVRPVPDKKRARTTSARGDEPGAAHATPTETFPAGRLKPIGPAALKALRERIRSGQYPSEEQVQGGLRRMFRSPE